MNTVLTNESQNEESRFGWIISLTFWIFLFIAACMFASVVLAPQYLSYLNLRNEYLTTQVQLVSLENQVEYLRQIAHSLEHDPEFRSEVARVDFDAVRPGEERIAVDPELALDVPQWNPNQKIPIVSHSWYEPMLNVLSKNQKVRSSILLSAAAIIILSFTFLHESQSQQLESVSRSTRNMVGSFLSRYQISETDPEEEEG
ncbi:MAG: septum formation initiator family protein [Planctomycetes bacterium]|nr:septum formation initiator family protein [Planctomycetota bacterium]MCH9725014.1 septum formation initiator family protein [Planctomycetota bacterium]MCH9779300.1 septum formation initiator family protein [Planctomycetota bacterium]MCH9791741.1 septum formation initiator family protein [Planctomycetota bacterium]